MDSGARIVTRGRETLDHGEWLQGRRHVIDTITGRSQHIPSRTTMKAISQFDHIHHNNL
jgi:hypothetical protein